MVHTTGTYGSDTVARAVARYTDAKVGELQSLYLSRAGAAYHDALAALSTLRKDEILSPWMQVGNMFLAALFDGWDETQLGELGRGPQQAVTAFQTALQLYAIHQRSKGEGVHASWRGTDDADGKGNRFGAACYELAEFNKRARRVDTDNAVTRRMAVVDSVSDFPGMVRGIRSLITMMRGADRTIVLDYGSLASDLYLMQFPESKPRVMQRWAGDYYHARRSDEVARKQAKTKKNQPA